MRIHLTQDQIRRFSKKIAFSVDIDACDLWTDAPHRNGYGRLTCGRAKSGTETQHWAHRVAWTLANCKPIPEGMCVLHHCDTPLCVNPKHLFIGTQADNVRDRDMKGRQSRGKEHGRRTLEGLRRSQV